MSDNPFLDLAGIPAPSAAPAAAAPTPTGSSELSTAIADAERKYDLPHGLLDAQIYIESRGNPRAVSPQGAEGISQLMPGTAKALGVDPFNPVQAVDGQARYLKQGIDATGSLQGGLMFYHGGPDQRGWGPKTRAYATDVLARLGGGDGPPTTNVPSLASVAPQPLSSVGNEGPNAFMALAGIDGAPSVPSNSGPSGVRPSSAPTAGAGGQGGQQPDVSDYLDTSIATPAAAPASVDIGAMGRNALDWAVAHDPLTDAAVNGGNNKLGRFGGNVQDAAAGLLHGAAKVPESLLLGAGWALDHVTTPITRFLGGNPAGEQTAATWMDNAANWMDAKSAGLAHDPNSPMFGSREVAGEGLATLPAFEVKALEAIPVLGDSVAARDVAAAAGDRLPMNTKLAAALTRYGDMAIGGATAGALASGGRNVGSNALSGAVIAPGADAVVEKVVAPVLGKVADAARASKLGKAIANTIDTLRSSPEAAIEASESGAPKTIATGAQVDDGAGITFKSQGQLAQFRHDFYPEKASLTDQQFLDWFGRSRQQPTAATVDQPQPVTASPSIPSTALGSAGARNGIESVTDLPPGVAEHVAQLRGQGVPDDQALREADIAYAGGKPTIATVTRDPAHQQAEAEGAKLVQTPEGRALNAQLAQNNAAITQSMQNLVARYGGAPSAGEGAEQIAKSLAQASDAERANVSKLYQQADNEALTRQAASDDATATAQANADEAAAIQAQVQARLELDDAQAALKTARTDPKADVDDARAAVEKAREKLRQATNSPPTAPSVPRSADGGYIDLSSVRAALSEPEYENPTIEGAKSLRSGVLGLLDAYGKGGDLVGLQQAERIRQAINDAYDPLGSSINAKVGNLKSVLDKALDDTDAGPAYRRARAAHKTWAGKYENPDGIARLIQRDAKGNFRDQDNWRKAENGLVGTLSDRQFIRVANRLHDNGDRASLNRLKALVLQRAYEAASKGALDANGNAIVSGDTFFNALNKVGLPKLRAVFSKAELADIASIGRAAKAINNRVPGTLNFSNTAATHASDIGRRLVEGVRGGHPTTKHAAGIHAGASLAGAAATLLGHSLAGPIGAGLVSGSKLASDALSKRTTAKMLAEALTDAADPASARAAARARASRLEKGLRAQALARELSRATGASASAAHANAAR